MPGKTDKQHRICIQMLDGRRRDRNALNKLKSNQVGMPFIDIVGTAVPNEFIVCAAKAAHIEQVRAKLHTARVEWIEGGDTTIAATATPRNATAPRRQGALGQQRSGRQQRGTDSQRQAPARNTRLPDKPYGFVGIPKDLRWGAGAPIWHDGSMSQERLSGEIRFELETLTPLLVGWERGEVGDKECDWPVPDRLPGVGQLADKKSVLCPLRAPGGKWPVIIPGDSLRGLLRHELGALLGAPMERVAERSYSYRPNAMYPASPKDRFLVPRLARVLEGHIEARPLDAEQKVRVPTRLELFPHTLQYNKKANKLDYRFDRKGGAPYRGGQGAGQKFNSKRKVHTSLALQRQVQTEFRDVSLDAIDGYLATVRHLVDLDHGHFSERHPDVSKVVTGDAARARILKATKEDVFQPGDFVWVEWDVQKERIVSFGWFYYYRWAYVDSVRRDADAPRRERHGLFPLEEERTNDHDGAPAELSAVRRLFGYAFDKENPGVVGVGKENTDYTQLMGRVFVNAGLEVVGDNDADDDRFLKPTFLKELGIPRPSAVEHYLKQNVDAQGYPQERPSDRARLVTYGDAAGYDEPGELAGRKFYLDRKDAYTSEPWKYPDKSAEDNANRQNERSTLALEASRPGRRFRFTIRFRDLDAAEVAAILVALCPDQFKEVLGGTHRDGYCSKLGYARPLGWGSVRIEAKQLLWLDETGEAPTLEPEVDLVGWVRRNHQETSTQKEWLDIHRRNHPNAADYPRERDRDGRENIYTFHTRLRAEHSRLRRYRNT